MYDFSSSTGLSIICWRLNNNEEHTYVDEVVFSSMRHHHSYRMQVSRRKQLFIKFQILVSIALILSLAVLYSLKRHSAPYLLMQKTNSVDDFDYHYDYDNNNNMNVSYTESFIRALGVKHIAQSSVPEIKQQIPPELCNDENPLKGQPMATGNSSTAQGGILVLGSGGLVGSALVSALQSLSFRVIEVRNRYDIDLRLDGALEALLDLEQQREGGIRFCFFLACEVGGSKFLSKTHMQQITEMYSERMQQSAMASLSRRGIPFLFASSQLAVSNNNNNNNNNTSKLSQYGEVKRRGEELALASGGKVFRIWNAYGPEPITFKSHVISDWVYKCLLAAEVHSLTDGHESRRFAHVDELAGVLIAMMHNFSQLEPATDLASDRAVTMREVAGIISEEVPCKIVFPDSQKAYYPSSREPQNLWLVPGSLRCGVRRLAKHYRSVIQRKKSAEEIYLSIIVATTNDDYNGIRSRLFTFLHFLGEQLSKSSLLYEVIVVQYNPVLTKDYYTEDYNEEVAMFKDLPVSQLFPLTQGIVSLAPLRIVTVPPESHLFADKGRFWEYVAKNTGAQAARGKFLLITNADNMFPSTLIAWLAKEQLQNNRVYRAGALMDEYLDQATCDSRGTGHGACKTKGLCLPNLNVSPTEHYCNDCLGDFSIFPRDVFLAIGGYFEYHQNSHIESGHIAYASGLQWFRESIQIVWMDESPCHRQHSRNGGIKMTITDSGRVTELMGSRQGEWGFSSHVHLFPEARASSGTVWDWGFNPETPYVLYPHHPLFQKLFPEIYSAPFDSEYLVDFAGTRTKYEYDCNNWFRYRKFHLSRRIACDRMDVFNNYVALDRPKGLGGEAFHHIPVFGDLPIIDEEYFEWLSLLMALDAWHSDKNERPFTVAEFGARYGTWVGRGGVMARRLRPDLGAPQICAVEADSIAFGWLQEHMHANQLYENATLIRGMVGSVSSMQPAVQWEPGSSAEPVQVYTVPEILNQYKVVDIVHIDIQGGETALMDKDVMAFLNERVRFLHIGTHGNHILADLKAAYVGGSGWELVHKDESEFLQGTTLTSKTLGPIRLAADGELALRNIRLAL